MSKPSQERIAGLIEMLLELLDAADLSDAEADTVCNILLPKLWQRSGLDVFALRAVISPMLPFRPSGPLQ